MARPSSTSSSEAAPERGAGGGFPWAGLVALLLVLAVDAWVFGSEGAWAAMRPWLTRRDHMERGLVDDRLALLRAASSLEAGVGGGAGAAAETAGVGGGPPAAPRVFLMGSSRAQRGLGAAQIARGEDPADVQPPWDVASLAHAGLAIFELRALADEVRAVRPDAVVLLLSEFDTHRPLALIPGTAPGSVTAVAELARAAGWRFVLRQREAFLRLLLAAVYDTYRFRDVLGSIGGLRLRRFPSPGELAPRALETAPRLLAGRAPPPLDDPALQAQLRAALPAVPAPMLASELEQCRWITLGPHVALQETLLADTVALLRAGGAQVLIVEAPLHPLAARCYDTSLRADFLQHARTLERAHGAVLLPLEESGPWGAEDFEDLTHLGPQGAARLGASVRARLEALFGERVRR